jgi:hypothetical protein
MILDFDQEYERAEQRRPFSNGFEGLQWTDRWCERCVRDWPPGCALLDVAFNERTPAAWTENHPSSLANRYTCTEWTGR